MPYKYDLEEFEVFTSEIWRYGLKGIALKQGDQQCVKIQAIPNGLVISVRWFNDEWMIARKTITRANEATFGSSQTLQKNLEDLFISKGSNID